MNIISANPGYEEIGTSLTYAIINKYIYIPKSPNIDKQRRRLYDENFLKILKDWKNRSIFKKDSKEAILKNSR